jgi:hypothetical protein
VHPRTFNTLRRILDGDSSALDEEEERGELAGPEKLLKDLDEPRYFDRLDMFALQDKVIEQILGATASFETRTPGVAPRT